MFGGDLNVLLGYLELASMTGFLNFEFYNKTNMSSFHIFLKEKRLSTSSTILI